MPIVNYQLPVDDHLRVVRDVVVNPLGVVNLEPYTASRGIDPKSAIHDVSRVGVVLNRVEQIGTMNLGPVVAGITVVLTKRIALGANRKLTGNGGRVRGAARAVPVLLHGPVAPAAREDGDLVLRGVNEREPTRCAVVALRLPGHLLLGGWQIRRRRE